MAWDCTADPAQPADAWSTEKKTVVCPPRTSRPKLSEVKSSLVGGPEPLGGAQLSANVSAAHRMNTSGEPGRLGLHELPVVPGSARMSAGSHPLGPFGATE